MTDLSRQTAKQRENFTYLMDVMQRLEWDLHNTIEATDRIPDEWHDIAARRPLLAKVKVNLGLEADVVRFFKSMGAGYGPRINDVLKSYMYARLAGLLKGAETVAHYRRSEELFDGPKPRFGDVARMMGEEGVEEEVPARGRVQEALQRMRGN